MRATWIRPQHRTTPSRGFTTLEVLIATSILAFAGVFYFGAQRVVQKEFTFITEGMRARQLSQRNLNEINRNLGALTDVAPSDTGDPNVIRIYQDFNYPRTPLDLEDDTEGILVYDPDLKTVQVADTAQSPAFRTVAENVEDFDVTVNGNLIVMEMAIKPMPHSNVITLRSAFALRNLPR